MGHYLSQDTFRKALEDREAYLGEREFIAIARALKDLAAELSLDPGPAIDALAHAGQREALDRLAQDAGTEAGRLRRRYRRHLSSQPT